MSKLISLPLQSLLIVCFVMTLSWFWATKIKNYSIVDAIWAFNFLLIAVLIFFRADGHMLRKSVTCALASLWSFRLGWYLGRRIFSHLHEEEGRYQQLRKDWAENIHLKFFLFFQAQALSNVWLSFPFFIISLNPDPEIKWNEWLGAGIWFLSVVGEAVADAQLFQFKKDVRNKGKVCENGLWYYSRHPNYFFQFMMWVGVLFFALSSPYGWLAVISPLSIAYLLFKVTGIPLTEEQSLRSKGKAYEKYQRTTSPFIPWSKSEN